MVAVSSSIVRAAQQSFFSPSASAITWQASKQTYLIARFLVDRDRSADAFRAYAYCRWVDDRLDGGDLSAAQRLDFVRRQCRLVERLYRGEQPRFLLPEERFLADLVYLDRDPDSGLRAYLHHMMAVMVFDAGRRGRLVSGAELDAYTRWLAVAVTEALHFFIGHDDRGPQDQDRYQAAAGAHIVHLLRDTVDDLAAGYVNAPRELFESAGISPHAIHAPAYRAWVQERVALARACFRAGRAYLAQVENARCRLAAYAYIARFEAVLDVIERDDCFLRADYGSLKSLRTGLWMSWRTLRDAASRRPALALMRPVTPAEG